MATASSTTEKTPRMSAADAKARWETGQPMTILDARSDDAYDASESRIKGDLRVDPHDLEIDPSWPREQLTLVYCT